MTGFLGVYEHSVTDGNRIGLPAAFRRSLPWDRKVLLMPDMDRVLLFPIEGQLETLFGQGRLQFYWSQLLKESVAKSRVLPSPLLFDQTYRSPGLAGVDRILREVASGQRRLSGQEWEGVVGDAFRACRYHVQERVKILEAETDLLLLEVDREGEPRLTIVECKQYSGSGRKVGVSAVLRLTGFGEALESYVHVVDKIIVTTTDFSNPAKGMSKVVGVDLWDMQRLRDWIRQHRIDSDQTPRLPLFTVRTLDARGRLRVPGELLSSASIRDKVVQLGMLDCVELSSPLGLERIDNRNYNQLAYLVGSRPEL